MLTAQLKRTFIPPEFRPKVKGEHLTSPLLSTKPLAKKKRRKKKAIICVHVADDSSQSKAISSHFPKDDIVFLVYDELGITWNFVFLNNNLSFFTDEWEIEPIGIYNRPYCPDAKHPQYHLCDHFMRALENWNGKKIGATSSHFQNSAKGYQLTTTIREAIKATDPKYFRVPTSYYIKGQKSFKKLLKMHSKGLIVKSGSGIRSEVATNEIFAQWELKHIDHLPTLFQEKCLGPDIRVHWTSSGCWQGILHEKNGSIDYRYAKNRKAFERMPFDSKIDAFCKTLATIEKLGLIGVDFIQAAGKFICLESNPNPGWAGFHRTAGDEPELVQKLIHQLELSK